MNKKGFTLIELLVVIAIIGILASVVLTQVNSARDKTLDVAIKGDLDGIRSASVVKYDDWGNKFTPGAYALFTSADCGIAAGQSATNLFGAEPNVALALSHINKSNGGVALTCNMAVNGTGFAIVSPLKTGGWVCLDGTGSLKTTQGTSGTTAYTAAVALTTGAVDNTTADVTCN